MSCYHPLKGWRLPDEFTNSGKDKYLITSYDVDHIEKENGRWGPVSVKSSSPYSSDQVNSYVEIPCGKCIGCRLDYSKQWADRCMLEASSHDSNYFVTLTYDDAHIPIVPGSDTLDLITGEMSGEPTLVKRDFQLFMKSLRKAYEEEHPGEKLRYFTCGEYGSRSGRPHYHALIFGLKLDDLILYKKSESGYNIYNSEFLSKLWKKGYVVVGDVSWETCAYTARYVMKKVNEDYAAYYDNVGAQREFTLMSRRPGIGRQYYEDNKDKLFSQEHVYLPGEKGAIAIKPGRYFKNLYSEDCPQKYYERQINRELAANATRVLKLDNTSLNYLEQLAVDELNKEESIKSLKRYI